MTERERDNTCAINKHFSNSKEKVFVFEDYARDLCGKRFNVAAKFKHQVVLSFVSISDLLSS